MAPRKTPQPEVVEVTADFTGIAVAADGGPQPPVSPGDVVAEAAANMLEYIAAQQQRINTLEYELSRAKG